MKPKQIIPEHYLVRYQATLIMLMSVVLAPASLFVFTIALVVIVKGHFSVEAQQAVMQYYLSAYAIAIGLLVYIALHWWVTYRYYRALSQQLFGLFQFSLLYGLLVVNIAMLIFTISYDLYGLPIFIAPIALIGITVYLIYLRRQAVAGHDLHITG